MTIFKGLKELKEAFTDLLMDDSITEDKEEMKFLIDAFAAHANEKFSHKELIDKMKNPEDLVNLFKEYLDHLAYQLGEKRK